jgi:ElaB/YqjD/DUF883 family membrane-anchored ribosome-binding protein
MENRNKTQEPSKTTGSSPTTNRATPNTPPNTTPNTTPGFTGQTSPIGQTSTPSTEYTSPSAASPQRARDEGSNVGNRTSEVIDQTKQVVSQAYDKTAETLTQTYSQAMEYGKENPGKLTLIAFGAGIGIGLLLAGGFSGGRSNRTSRIAEPAIDALSRIAMEFFR